MCFVDARRHFVDAASDYATAEEVFTHNATFQQENVLYTHDYQNGNIRINKPAR